MAKYGKFDARNKKRSKDKYRSEKRSPKAVEKEFYNEKVLLKEIEKRYNF